MKIVIIEDEPRAAKRLEKLINLCLPQAQVVKWLESAKQGVDYFKAQPRVDLIFSDIQLADDLSFEIFKTVDVSAPIIFTTAYNEYAIQAFKTNGIDYLLKPLRQEDVEGAIAKYKGLTAAAPEVNMAELAALLQHAGEEKTPYKKRFLIKVGAQLKAIPVQDILAFYSKDKANFMYTNAGRSYPVEDSMDHIETVLDPDVFYRANRGFIYGIHANASISSYSNSRLRIELKGLNEMVVVAREKTKAFKNWLEK